MSYVLFGKLRKSTKSWPLIWFLIEMYMSLLMVSNCFPWGGDDGEPDANYLLPLLIFPRIIFPHHFDRLVSCDRPAERLERDWGSAARGICYTGDHAVVQKVAWISCLTLRIAHWIPYKGAFAYSIRLWERQNHQSSLFYIYKHLLISFNTCINIICSKRNWKLNLFDSVLKC